MSPVYYRRNFARLTQNVSRLPYHSNCILGIMKMWGFSGKSHPKTILTIFMAPWQYWLVIIKPIVCLQIES